MTMSPGEMTDKRVGHFGVPVEGLKDSFQRMDRGGRASWDFLGPIEATDYQREWVFSLQGLRREAAGLGPVSLSNINILCVSFKLLAVVCLLDKWEGSSLVSR